MNFGTNPIAGFFLSAGWTFWISMLGWQVVKKILRYRTSLREQKAALAKPIDEMTLDDLRVLHMGDRRGPFERHADRSVACLQYFTLVIVGMSLVFFTENPGFFP